MQEREPKYWRRRGRSVKKYFIFSKKIVSFGVFYVRESPEDLVKAVCGGGGKGMGGGHVLWIPLPADSVFWSDHHTLTNAGKRHCMTGEGGGGVVALSLLHS